jgi:hypothetical protein
MRAPVLALAAALAGCTSYASTTRVNAPGIVDISTPVPREDGSDTLYQTPSQPETQAVIAWLHPSFAGGLVRKGPGFEAGLSISVEKDDPSQGDLAISNTAWGATLGAGIVQVAEPEGGGEDVDAGGPLHAEIYHRRFIVMFGAGALVYPDTRDVGVQATLRCPLAHVRARYVQDTGFEVVFGFDLSFPFVFGWSR